MSELQVGLLVVGAAVVAAVFLYNIWQERRYRREAEAGFAAQREDVLMRSGGGAGQGSRQGRIGSNPRSCLSRRNSRVPGIRARGCQSFWTSSSRLKLRRRFLELP